jgi:hypothetical protein
MRPTLQFSKGRNCDSYHSPENEINKYHSRSTGNQNTWMRFQS